MSIFLDDDDVARLAGTKIKARQVAQLRVMGILFYINAAGRPVVPRSAVEGNGAQLPKDQSWTPNVLKHGQKAV